MFQGLGQLPGFGFQLAQQGEITFGDPRLMVPPT